MRPAVSAPDPEEGRCPGPPNTVARLAALGRAAGALFRTAQRLVRTHAFRLAGLYFLVFALSVIGVLFFVYWSSADFVERQPDGRYEVVDTKLARHSKPAYVLQLCFYSEQVARIQGTMPDRMHVVLGTHERESLRVTDFLAYYHRVRERFVRAIEVGIDVYPLPVSFCDRCEFQKRCEARWREDDHLSLVARMRGDQVRRLEASGIARVGAFAQAPNQARPAARTRHPMKHFQNRFPRDFSRQRKESSTLPVTFPPRLSSTR